MWQVSAASLVVVMALCVVGTFSCKYDDNLFQRIGMFFIFVGFFPRLREVLATEDVTPGVWLAHLGLAMFAIGQAHKAWKYRGENAQRVNDLRDIEHEDTHHVAGGKKE